MNEAARVKKDVVYSLVVIVVVVSLLSSYTKAVAFLSVGSYS
jgi:hypothetical protein